MEGRPVLPAPEPPATLATVVGVVLFFLYPLGVLAYDAFLKVEGDSTITRWVSAADLRRALAVGYIVTWTVLLGGHFWFGWLDGFARALPRAVRRKDRS